MSVDNTQIRIVVASACRFCTKSTFLESLHAFFILNIQIPDCVYTESGNWLAPEGLLFPARLTHYYLLLHEQRA